MYSTYQSISLDYGALVQNADEILEYVFRRADSFSIVTDSIKPYSQNPARCKQDAWTADLEKYLMARKIGAREWPGTQTRDPHKVLSTYKVCRQAKAIVKAWPNAFQALEYGLPEDICFYRDGKFWFGTTSHEETADVVAFSKEDEDFFCSFKRPDDFFPRRGAREGIIK